MADGARSRQRHDRMREYEGRLDAARAPVAVLARFAQAREARSSGAALEAEFAAAGAESAVLPAAAWMALRQGDADAVIAILVEHASEQFVVAEHEQLDADYRLRAVPECRGLPDVARLVEQVAAFVQVPTDVVTMLTEWGPDDPRTGVEVERLMDQRFGTPAEDAPRPALYAEPVAEAAAPTRTVSASRARLSMSSQELAGVLSLSAQQRGVLATLVRQADIVVSAG